MKKLLVLAGVFAALPSFASFELVLVLDKGNGKVHRFDGVTGAYFGSFGNFTANVRSLTLDKTTNIATVFDTGNNGNVYRFNYNTGELVGFYSGLSSVISHFSAVEGQNRYLVSLSTTQFNLNTELGTISAFDSGLALSRGRAFGSNVVTIQNDRVRLFTASGTLLSEAAHLASPSINGDIIKINRFGGGTYDSVATVTGGTNGGRLIRLIGTSYANQGGWFSTLLSTASGVAPAHVGMYAVGKNVSNAAQGRVVRMAVSDASTTVPLNNFGENVLMDPVDVATVVAPEPGTIAAVALGLAALVRRRKS